MDSLIVGVGCIPLRARDGSVRAWTYVDLADFAALSQHRWCLKDTGYVVRATGGRKHKYMERMHRRIMGLDRDDPREVDHKDGQPLNNRRSNLRVCTHAENQQNMHRARALGPSVFRGVGWDRVRLKWVAWGKLDGKTKFLGRFDDEEQAAATAREHRERHYPFALD